MSDALSNGPLPGGRPTPIDSTGASRPAQARQDASKPQFRALLERLEQRAASLREAGEDATDAQGLGQAVAQAKESLDEVLGLKDQLLEAYARQQLLNDNDTPEQ